MKKPQELSKQLGDMIKDTKAGKIKWVNKLLQKI